jgi:hypothetical protein
MTRWMVGTSLVLMVPMSAACSPEKHAADPGSPTAAYLTFDEGGGTIAADSSGNGHAATLLGGATWNAGLVGSSSLSLPGTAGSFAEIPTAVVDTSQSFTVAAWVKLAGLTGYQTFVSEDGEGQSAATISSCAPSLASRRSSGSGTIWRGSTTP